MDERIETLIKLLTEALGFNQQLQKLQDQFLTATANAKSIEEVRRLLKSYSETFSSTVRPEADRLAEALKSAEALRTHAAPFFLPGDLAKQFRTLIDNSQREARIPGDHETAATIKSLDVELKGLIVVQQNQAGIIPPQPDKPIDAGQLSTIRMSFGSIPVLKNVQQPSSEPTKTPGKG